MVVIFSPQSHGFATRDAPRKRLIEQGVVSHKKGAYSRYKPLESNMSPSPIWHVSGVNLRETGRCVWLCHGAVCCPHRGLCHAPTLSGGSGLGGRHRGRRRLCPRENINTAVVVPQERSEDQGILLKHMSQLNQRLLGPWENADGQRLPRLTMVEAVAQLMSGAQSIATTPSSRAILP